MSKPRGRPKGSKNRPTALKPGPKPFAFAKVLSPQQIADFKLQIIQLIEAEQAYTVTEASDLLGLPKTRVQRWRREDKEWAKLLFDSEQIKADRIEAELARSTNMTHSAVIAKMFLLKKLRPEYRENAKIELSSEPLERLLKELRDAAKPTESPPQESSKGESV